MTQPVRVLLVEDQPLDAELIVLALEDSGLIVTHRRVDTESSFLEALRGDEWDVVLSDYSLPHYSGLKALTEVRRQSADLPFILISGTIGEEAAVEAMKRGASDCLMKDKLASLAVAVQRQIAEAKARVERRLASEALRERDRLRSRELLNLAEASFAISRAESMEALMNIGTERAAKIIEVHQAVSSFTMNESWSQAINAVYLSPKYAKWSAYSTPPDGSGIYRIVCQQNVPMRLTQAELQNHSAWRGFSAAASEHPPMRGWLAAPLISRDGNNIGLIQLSDKCDGGDFTPDDEAVLVQIAQILSVAVENLRLFDETRRAYEEAKRTNKMKDEFLATLSHELRTPLNSILGHAELLLLDAPTGSEDFRSSLETIKRNARAQTELIEDLLDVSRIITGKLTLDVSTVDLASLMQAALASIKFAADAKNISLTLSIEPKAGLIRGDASRLQQVFWNLLSNAIKFTPAGGKIEFILKRSLSKVQIDVIDSGAGIDPSFKPHIFERFRQEDSSLTRYFGGLGLGLAIVRHIVELHGGTVHVESEGKGKGSTFRVCLPPLAVLEPTGAEGWGDTKDWSTSEDVTAAFFRNERLSGVRILACDDQRDSREMVAKILRRAGAGVELASSAKEALALAKTHPFDVLIFDIGMPEEDGISLMRKIRALDGKAGQTPAIALTAYVRGEDEVQTAAAGFQFHVGKPVTPMVLLRSVAKLVMR